MDDILVSPFEFKFIGDGATGEFSGYAAIFNNQDSHGDVILPGAFADTLAERKAQGRGIPMHVMHGIFGGDGIPVGVWNNVQEDDKGLVAEGKISGMNTDAGRLLYERIKDGALSGISIGYRIKPGGSKLGKSPGEPKRTIKSVHLGEISLVDEPSNALARVKEVKQAARSGSRFKAAPVTEDGEDSLAALGRVITWFDAWMAESSWPTAKDKALVMDDLLDVYQALSGGDLPSGLSGWKLTPVTIRELETFLREKGLTRSQARDIAAHGFKAAAPRDEAVEQASITADLLGDLKSLAASFSTQT